LTKRIFDITAGLLLLISALPFILIFAVFAAIELKAIPFFTQERGITLTNKRIRIAKLRTLRKSVRHSLSSDDIFLKPHLSEFVTPFCKFLRLTGLDELPQLLNVVLGEMSLVGPRPLSIEDLTILKTNHPDLYEIRDKIKCKPGITGLWQLKGDRNKGAENLIMYDIEYDKNYNVINDIKIVLMSIPIFPRTNRDAIVK